MRHLKADSKGRIVLGAKYAGALFLEVEKNNVIILEKASIIPERELWLHKNKKAKKSVLKGLEQAKKGELKSNEINDEDEGDME
jgi:hypothetical protein